MKKIYWFITACSLFYFHAKDISAQNLPRWLTETERMEMPAYLQRHDLLNGTPPPPFTPRTLAEWEEIQGLLITWTQYPDILRQVVKYAQTECTVYIVCSDSNSVKNDLTSHGIPLTNVKYMKAPFNTIWSRDYGPWNIYASSGKSVSLTDWIYNRPRPADDTIPEQLARLLHLPIYQMTKAPNDLIATGGNYMVDGHGTAFSSKLILDENPGKSESQIDNIVNQYQGITRYIKMETLPYDQIHHIDMHMKLLDEETLLVGQFPDGVSDGPQIDSNIAYIQRNYLDCFGNPYKIIRIPMPPGLTGKYPPQDYYRTYTNSVIVNKTLIIPTYREEYDTTAFRIYREAMPGYNIVGIDCDNGSFPIISQLGAIHCITKEIGADVTAFIHYDPNPLSIQPLMPHLVQAEITSGAGINNATVYWSTDTSKGYEPVSMTPFADDSFYAYIPGQPAGTKIFYYIEAETDNNHITCKPLVAPRGTYHFVAETTTGMNNISNPLPVLYDPYPNPAADHVQVGFVIPYNMSCSLRVIDCYGRVVREQEKQSLQQGSHVSILNTNNLSSGIYWLELIAGSDLISRKLIIAHP